MKISDLRVNEGAISDYIAKKGLLGKARQYAAYGAQLDKEKEAARAQQNKQQFQKFLRDLPIALAKAYASGVVVDNVNTPVSVSGVSESRTPVKFFRSLMESVSLNESMSKEDFVKQYLETLFKNYKLTPQIIPALQAAIKEFSNAFVYNPKLPAEKHTASKAQIGAATKIWQVYDSAKSLQGAQVVPPASPPAPASRINAKYAFPKTDIIVSDNKGNDFAFKKTPTGGEWKDEAGTLITDPADQDLLNKLAFERAKTMTATTQPSSVSTQTSPATASQKMTIGGQTLDPNNPVDAKIIAKIQAQAAGQSGAAPTTNPIASASVPQRRLAGGSAAPRQQMRQRP